MMPKRWESVLLLTARFIAGGAFIIAPIMKLQDPKSFMLAIQSFELLPTAVIPFLAYWIPWMELAAGVLLVYGVVTRPAALVAFGLYAMFTAGLLYVIYAGLPVDCGCFGGIFGGGTVDWSTIGRNGIFLAASALVLWRGPGAASVEALFAQSPNGDPARRVAPEERAARPAEAAS